MLAVVQRVKQSKILIADETYSEIDQGYVILLGIFAKDKDNDVKKLVEKIICLRIMADEQGKMNKSILEIGGELLVVSQFTLVATLRGGRRPSFVKAMKPEEAIKLYELFIKQLKEKGVKVKSGKFGAKMEVQIFNDGPVTIIVDSSNL